MHLSLWVTLQTLQTLPSKLASSKTMLASLQTEHYPVECLHLWVCVLDEFQQFILIVTKHFR